MAKVTKNSLRHSLDPYAPPTPKCLVCGNFLLPNYDCKDFKGDWDRCSFYCHWCNPDKGLSLSIG